MTRAEVDRIKARMLDQVFDKMANNVSPEAICDLIKMQMHTNDILEYAMQMQNEELKEQGYQVNG